MEKITVFESVTDKVKKIHQLILKILKKNKRKNKKKHDGSNSVIAEKNFSKKRFKFKDQNIEGYPSQKIIE